MKKFEISITQTSKMYVEVEAETLEQAKQRVTKEWYRGEHPMDENHFLSVEFDGEEKQNEKMKVVLLEPGYYFEEPVCVVLNEEGKMIGLDLNRGVYDENKKLIDIIAGTAFICDCSGENFGSLNDEQIKKYSKMFRYPERFFKVNDEIKGIPFNPKNKEYER